MRRHAAQRRRIHLKRTISALGTLTLIASTATPALAQKGKPSTPAPTVVTVLDFEADWTSQPGPLSGAGWSVPGLCATELHTAGPNETALVSMSAFVGTAPSSQYVGMLVMTSADGYTYTVPTGTQPAYEAYANGAADVVVTKKMPLVDGLTYTFGAGIRSTAAVSPLVATCHGLVTIVRGLP